MLIEMFRVLAVHISSIDFFLGAAFSILATNYVWRRFIRVRIKLMPYIAICVESAYKKRKIRKAYEELIYMVKVTALKKSTVTC